MITFQLLPMIVSVTILPLGDSHTAQAGYRMVLQTNLMAAGIPYDMVGDTVGSCLESYDCDHAGHSGYTIERITDVAQQIIPTLDPEIVFLLAGTNNHWGEPDFAGFVQKYSMLIEAIGDRRIYMATVPKFGYGRTDREYWTDDFVDFRNNTLFPMMNDAIYEVASRNSNVVVVDYYSVIDPALHLKPDCVHPNTEGHQILADLFWNAAFVGDSNLDGNFDTGDLVQVLQSGKYETSEPASWTEGDWNLDGAFSTGDLVTALQTGRYERGISAGSHAVPEPSSATLLLTGLLLLRRRR